MASRLGGGHEQWLRQRARRQPRGAETQALVGAGSGAGRAGPDRRRGRRQALELRAYGEESRAAGAELEEAAAAVRPAGERSGDGELGLGTPVGPSQVRGALALCVLEATAAARARERKEAGQRGR